ncbi:MAG: septum formation initiator family protein [Wenzhouxiangella sp.]|jgi:cell division protein FtsB|nr:septum formation initiator family protein [Wenzhouxiangella sp.]
MRVILIALLVILLVLQVQLWRQFSEVRTLRELVEEQQAENDELQKRNEALAAEVEDLRAGLEAIEERARSELGLIRKDEEFFLIVDPEDAEPQG